MKTSKADIILTIFFFCLLSGYSQNLTINEVMSSNDSVLFDEDGDTPDWIELYNADTEEINMEGYGISDDPANLFKWIFPGKIIAPDEHLIICASSKNKPGVGVWETIIDWGDDWRYWLPTAELPDNWRLPGYNHANWPEGMSGFGYGDDDDATLINNTMSVYIRKTFSVDQLPAILGAVFHIDYDDGFVAYLNGQEIARANLGTPGTIPAFDEPAITVTEPKIIFGGYPDAFTVNPQLLISGTNVLAIELHNIEINSSDLTLIPFFSVLLESTPPNPNGTPPLLKLNDPLMHTNFKISAAGETIYLTHPSGSIIDSLVCGNLPINVSRGRQPDGAANLCYFNESSPGASNSTACFPDITNTVQFSLPGGFYPGAIQVTLSTDDPSDVIHYTTDGTEPGEESPVYSNAFYIVDTRVLRAVAFHPGYLPSRSVTHTYFINENHDLPVFSLSTAPANLFDPAIGIYHENNIYQEWERPIHVEFFDTDDTSGFSIDAGVKLYGAWTRNLPQKSLAIFARESYGYGEVEYPIFPNLPYDKYESFILRNSGNDWQNTMFRDGLMTGLVAGDGIDIQAFRPSVVYINGEYWGIHNIREKLTTNYIEQHYGIPEDSLDLLENQQLVVNGDNIHYSQMISYIESHPMSEPENYEYIKTIIDIPEFISYEIAQIYFANTDWPGNNIKYWRARASDGKWRWFLYDTDFGFGLVESYTHNTLAFATDPAGPDWPNPPWSTFLLRELLTSEEFKIDFINRYADLINSSFKSDTVLDQIDQKKSWIFSEIPNHCSRWGGDIWQWLSNIEVMRDFAIYRKNHAQNHVLQYFDLIDDSEVTLNIYPESAGHVQISTLNIDKFPWSGEYFNGIPVRINAIANPGYRFIRWEGGYVSDTSEIILYFNGNKQLTAVFEAYTPDLLVINEINYNSSPEFNTEDWIEIYNPNNYEVNLGGWVFKDEEDLHSFPFSQATVLGGNGFLVVCADTASFHSWFPDVLNYTGNFDFGLSGGGELIRLLDFSGLVIDTVNYDDTDPWPEEPDGNGPTLELIHADLDNALPESWMASGQHGTPGNPNGIYIRIGEEQKKNLDLRILPNPMASETNLLLISEWPQVVSIEILNSNGASVMQYPEIHLGTGTHHFQWNGKDLSGCAVPNGLYFCKVSSGEVFLVKKLIKQSR